ncbi:fluoroquinolone transport system permease protein [Catalinimonas alkaloidigena]|uniref:Fluoroquinolone transport system permease protein n=1 Tax=Catalinimonas alkaloidigena TaxID=1075417 RepID=A0A1G9S9T2_9BACT|nr:hypothetical protein [Catalinimonas alkaloidigena]SDM32229.1 fluoroquinolone transport system permease protein [Catalinimonas alkaloidigena]
MNRLLLLGANDFRMVFRDPMLRLFLFLPLLIVGGIGWALPPVLDRFPVLGDYGYVILMWACMQTATMFGFINGFVFLEEKDDGVFTALRIMPISAAMLLGFRMALGVVMTTAVNLILLLLNPVLPLDPLTGWLVAFQFSLLAPLFALLVAVFAKNKVEGLAQFKIYNLVLNLPILIYFLPYGALHAFAVVPTYWNFRTVEALHEGASWLSFYGIGLAFYGIYFVGLIRLFERRVF